METLATTDPPPQEERSIDRTSSPGLDEELSAAKQELALLRQQLSHLVQAELYQEKERQLAA